MFSRILTSGLIAGAATGLIAALLQLWFVQPVLLHAELYESGQLIHNGAQAVSAHQPTGPFEWTRNLLSVLFSMMVYAGYGLMLTALMSLRGTVTPRQGLLWGVAGFVTMQLAPAFGLAPEVPGVAAADVTQRALWWLGTALATGIAIWLIAFGRGWLAWGAAVVLILAPHVIGAPQPDAYAGTVPPELSAEFAGRALGVGLMAWVLLGLISAWVLQRDPAHSGLPQAA
ncbi:CbtA family protein [Paracoccus laeviglucosivorans]|uniref:Cobalt transporter subunit CbtA n=1 Tax=Paracoccus laeviglucosivorans TaxID=1197861 RepID=A0A521DVI1_9RHOB|nr:CbtA family protein [Paracoccus laeviglucosivorans]SMO75759.1 cobalt transporter subunit CbtA [Paracoccus laeviglucosivorans]